MNTTPQFFIKMNTKTKITAEDINYTLHNHTFLANSSRSKHIHTVVGKINIYNPDTDSDVEIGSFDVSVVKISDALNTGEDQYDIIDETQNIYDAAMAIFNLKDGRSLTLKKNIEKTSSGFCLGDFALIESVKIHPEWRGANIGIAVIRDYIVNHLDLGTIVILRPYPFSDDAGDESESMIESRSKKLQAHWKQIGFKPIKAKLYGTGKVGGKPSVFMILNTDCVLPEVSIEQP